MNKKKYAIAKIIHFSILNLGIISIAASFSFYLWKPCCVSDKPEKGGKTSANAPLDAGKKGKEPAVRRLENSNKQKKDHINISRINRLIQSELRLKEKLSKEIAYSIYRHTAKESIPPELIIAIMKIESHGRPDVVSNKGAMGLLQIMPFWKRVMKMEQADLFDPDTNIRMGVEILKRYIKRYKRIEKALAAYNGSLGSRRYPKKVLKVYKKILDRLHDGRLEADIVGYEL